MKRIIIAIALSFILASCGGSDQPSGLYAGGTNGLVFSFEDGAPPDLVYDNAQTPMPIIMRVKNDGEFDTQNLHIRLSGISTNDFEGLPPIYEPTNTYTGKALIQDDLIEGSEAFLEVGEAEFTRSLRGGGSLDYTLHADACYGYATVGTAQVCFESNYNDADETCDPDSSSLEVSGGPVQISNLETNAIGGNVLRISFDVNKAGNVEIWKPTGTQRCNPPDRARIAAQENWVYVRVDDGFDAQSIITCSNLLDSEGSDGNVIFSYPQEYRESLTTAVRRDAQGYVRLSGGDASVTCTARIPSGADGESTIDIALAYYVEDRISHPFTVVHTDVPLAEAPGGAPTGSEGPNNDPNGTTQTPATPSEELSFSQDSWADIERRCRSMGREAFSSQSVRFLQPTMNQLNLEAEALQACLNDASTYPNCEGTLSGPGSTHQAYDLLEQRARESLGSEYISITSAQEPGDTAQSWEAFFLAACITHIESN